MILSVNDEHDRDSWVTPLWLARAVGRWDLDCCTNARSHILCDRSFDLARGQDALVLGRYVSRNTRVWCNPPYSRGMVAQFVEAFCHTRFCFLVRSDTSTDWWAALWPYVAVEARPKERINFEPPPGVEEPPGNPYPHSLLYANAIDVTATVIETCYVTTVQHQRRLKT